jgi:hypothetical protein
VYGEARPIFFAKSSAFSGGVGSCVVSMINESPPINLRAERKKFCANIHRIRLDIKYVAFWKRVESMKFQWIPSNCNHHFWVLDGMSWSFMGLFFSAKLDLLMVCRKIKP